MEAALECASRLVVLVERKARKELFARVEALLEALDAAEVPAWLSVAWTEEQAGAVAQASETARGVEKATSVSEDEAAGAVKAVLGSLEAIVSSAGDKAEQLVSRIDGGDDGAGVEL